MIEPRLYQQALDAQSACNLSGIVHAMSRAMTALWKHANENGEGTTFVNEHPISRLYAEQIAFLSGAGTTTNYDSYDSAHKIATVRADAAKEDAE